MRRSPYPFTPSFRRAIAIAVLSLGALSLLMLFGPAAESAGASFMHAPVSDVSAQRNLDVLVSYESLHVRSGGTMTFFVTVTEGGYPVNDSVVLFTSDAPDKCFFDYENGGRTDADGRLVVHMQAYSEELAFINLTVTANYSDVMPGYHVVKLVTVEPPSHFTYTDRISYIGITGGLIALLFLGSTEAGRYALMKSMFLPLYSRIKRDDLLDHFVRGQIYGHIMSHPGEHYNRIKTKLGVTNGTLSHHLRALEFQGYIKSQRDGTYKRFYPTEMKVPRTKGIKLSDLQIGILDAIRQCPGISQREIATREGISQQSVSYNLSLLERMGVIGSSREGIKKRYFISPET